MTNYKYQGTDLDDLLEPIGSFNPPNPDFTGYGINGTSMTSRFAAYDGKGWEKLFSSTYLHNGTPVQACQKGYKPSVNTRFCTINGSAGQAARDIYISRTDSALTFSGDVSLSFGPSSFRNNKVPMSIGILTCAGGGGKGHQYSNRGPYYGGGGGAIGWFVISFEGVTDSYRLRLGRGGAAYSNGGATVLYLGTTYILSLEAGGYHDVGTGGDTAAPGRNLNVVRSVSSVFAVNGEVLDNTNKSYVAGCSGFSELANGRTVSAIASVAFDASDTPVDFGVPSTVVPSNDGKGGGSLNGSMVDENSNGTDGAGCGALASSGGAGAAFFFY